MLIPTTRSPAKAAATVSQLKAFALETQQKLDRNQCAGEQCALPLNPITSGRITIQPAELDLSRLSTVRRFVRYLTSNLGVTHVDVVIMNAGIGGWSGINWLRCVYQFVMEDWISVVTYPIYKLAHRGLVTAPQIPVAQATPSDPEPSMGEVFCANVFGHYLLGYYLAPLLRRAFEGYGRILWVGSLEAYGDSLDVQDIQALKSDAPYESTKRLTEMLCLTSRLPETAKSVSTYLAGPPSTDDGKEDEGKDKDDEGKDKDDGTVGEHVSATPGLYLCHPGICGTSIFPLIFPLPWLMFFSFWIARLLGAVWHTISPVTGAKSAVWLATIPGPELERAERSGVADELTVAVDSDVSLTRPGTPDKQENKDKAGSNPTSDPSLRKVKWGSGASRLGDALVLPTEVEGWGVRGIAGERPTKKGSTRPALKQATTVAEQAQFVADSVDVWAQMEKLRVEWEGRLDRAGL